MKKGLFHNPGIFLTNGIISGQFQPEDIINRIADNGFKWVAQEFGENQPSQNQIDRTRATCQSRGINWGIWEVTPTDIWNIRNFHPELWILNVESRVGDYSNLLSQFRSEYPLLPAGVVTNCDIDPIPFIKSNIKAIPECYQVDDANATPQNMVNLCHQMGWKVVFPSLGVYDNYALLNYKKAGDGYSIYLAEGMNVDDWRLALHWNTLM